MPNKSPAPRPQLYAVIADAANYRTLYSLYKAQPELGPDTIALFRMTFAATEHADAVEFDSQKRAKSTTP
jgi:hypothetical protein